MKRFIEGDNRQQITLLPESLDEYIDAENPVRIVDLFVDQLDLGGLGFSVEPAANQAFLPFLFGMPTGKPKIRGQNFCT